MEEYIVISSITSEPQWKNIFNLILNYCDKFEIIYDNSVDDSDNMFLVGRNEFEKLEGVSINPWSGMSNSSIYSGELNSISKQLFLKYVSPSFDGFINELWYFKLYKGEKLYMHVEDFTVCLLNDNEELRKLLKENGINISALN